MAGRGITMQSELDDTNELLNRALEELGVDPPVPDTPIDDHFRAVVASDPSRLALTGGPRPYTYSDLDQWSDAIAADLIAADAPRDRPLAILTASNIALVPCILAAIKSGHFFVMIDPTDPRERVSLLLDESEASICLTDAVTRPERAIPMVEIRPFGSPAPPSLPRLDPNPVVYLIYTSGTTGKPKGIASMHRHFVEHSVTRGLLFGCGPGIRRGYTALPGYTRAASAVFSSLLTATTLCAFDARTGSLSALADYLREEQVHRISLSPPLFRRLVAASPPGMDLSSIQELRLGADRVTMADVDAFKRLFPPSATLHVGFAASETSAAFEMKIHHDTELSGPLVPMGRPKRGVEVQLLDEEGNPVPDGTAGELVITSRLVAEGYWKNPELTAERFSVDPNDPERRTFRTGDLVRRESDGNYYFIGRSDSRLKIRGRRIDPSEVEAAFLATGGVREAVVVGKTDRRGEQELVAYVVMQPGAPCVPRALRSELRRTSPAWMIPTRIVELEAIPMTPATKIDRAALTARQDDEIAGDDGAADDLERQVVAIWAEVIDRPVHVDDDFFDDLGGESLMAAHIVTEIEKKIGKTIPPSLLLELNTPRRMAAWTRSADEAIRHVVELKNGSSEEVPLFCVAGGGGAVLRFRELSEALGPEQPFYGVQTHGFDLDHLPETFAGIAASYCQAIRSIQPDGPYFIAGYSSGGKLAYEIACQLVDSGEQVALLGIIDTSAVNERAGLWDRLRNRIEILRQNPLRAATFAREAAMRPSKWMMNRLVQKLLGKGVAVPPRIIQNALLFRGLSQTHQLRNYPGTLTLFRARHGLKRVRVDQDLGWRPLVAAMEILDVDGDHETMLNPPYVQTLAEAMRTAIQTARERTESTLTQVV